MQNLPETVDARGTVLLDGQPLQGAAIVLAYSRGWRARIALSLGALAIAIALHSTFNRLTVNDDASTLLVTVAGIGVFAIAVGIVENATPGIDTLEDYRAFVSRTIHR